MAESVSKAYIARDCVFERAPYGRAVFRANHEWPDVKALKTSSWDMCDKSSVVVCQGFGSDDNVKLESRGMSTFV